MTISMTPEQEAAHQAQWNAFKARADEIIHGTDPMYGMPITIETRTLPFPAAAYAALNRGSR